MDYFYFFNTVLPWVWFGIAVLCVVIELATMGLTTIWFAIGALVMMFVAFFSPLAPIYQILIFLAISSVLLFFTRPFAVKKMHLWQEKTNVDSLIGKDVIVTKTIKAFEKGEVKFDGKIWTAKTVDNTEVLEGTECTLVKIEGVTAIVQKK